MTKNKLKFLAEIVMSAEQPGTSSDQKIVLFHLPEHNQHYHLND